MSAVAIGVLACAAWAYLLAARGRFWRAQPRDEPSPPLARGVAWPPVAAIVPARDEADVIAGCVQSLVTQRYAGKLSVIVVDDASSDATAENAGRAAAACGAGERLTVVAASPTPDGWTGKLWALQCGIAYVQTLPDAPDVRAFHRRGHRSRSPTAWRGSQARHLRDRSRSYR